MIDCPPDAEYMEVNVASAKTIYDASEYSFTVLTMGELTEPYLNSNGQMYPAGFDGGMLSSMRMVFSIELLKDTQKLQQYQDFLLFACQQLPIRGGYAGLSMALPDNRHRYLPQEYFIATQFSGLDIDSYWFIDKNDYGVLSVKGEPPQEEFFPYQYAEGAEVTNPGYIKGVTWYNILPKIYFERMGGWEYAKAKLKRSDIEISELDDDMLIIRAGETPQLGSKEQGLPEAYIFVNQVLKHLRNPESQALQPDLGGIENANEDNSRRWRARFDLEELAPKAIQLNPYENITVNENESASVEGYYQDSLTQKVVYLKVGDIAPSFPPSQHGTKSQAYVCYKLSPYGIGLIDISELNKAKR